MRIEYCVPIVGVDISKARNPHMGCTEADRIRLVMSYNLGGMHWFTLESRGYYLAAAPEAARNGTICYMLGAGIKYLLLEVSRQSKKRAMEACAKAEQLAPQLVEWCCNEYGLIVEPTEIKFNAEGKQ